jgi:hypothetical protein
LNLGKLRPPAASSAAVADGALLAGYGGANDVTAVAVVFVTDALAGRGASDADANLVDLGGLGTGRDEPTTAALVAGEELVAVELEEPTPAKGVTRLRFGGG